MASIKIKIAAAMATSLLIGSALTAALYHYLLTPVSAPGSGSAPQSAERKVLFWYDPMYPNTKFDRPGPSPFMDMDLVPKYAEDDVDGGQGKPGIRIDPTQTQNLGLRTETIGYGRLDYSYLIPANIGYNEYQYAIVQARSGGFVDKVYPITVGDRIVKGAPLLEVTVPAWVEAQSEYLVMDKMGSPSSQLNGALERLRLAGMPQEDIQRFTESKKIATHFVIKAPIDGVITAFDLREGMNIAKDNVVAKIQGINPIWLHASVPESIAYLITTASTFAIEIPALPDGKWAAKKWTILPSSDPFTRTVQVRLEVDNPDERLKPGMSAFIRLNAQSETMLLVPSSAIIDSGDEQRVITVNSDGRFVPKRVKVYRQSQQKTALLSGVEAGESVVVSGLFLIDSEANIAGALDRMRSGATPPTSSGNSTAAVHRAH